MTNQVDTIKDAINCQQFAAFMGLQINRSGFTVCPFHGDKDASLKIYKDGRGWYCFGCHRGGDVISLAQLYYGLGFKETLKRLNDDFGLGLFEDAAETGQNRVLMAVEIAKQKAALAKAERLKKALELEYWTAYDKWLDADRRVRDNEGDKDADFSETFVNAIVDREKAYQRLSCLEMERITYVNK